MPILYGCISRRSVILVDKTLGPEEYQSAAREILNGLQIDVNRRTSFPHDDLNYHTISEDGLVYMCAADRESERRVPYTFLDEHVIVDATELFYEHIYRKTSLRALDLLQLKREFLASTTLVRRSFNAGPYEFNREFRQVLGDLMDKYNSGKGDHLTSLQAQVGQVTGIMRDNIEKVLERGDKLDDLVDKTEDLQASATTFKVTSQKISRKMFWKNRKMMIIIVVVVLVLIAVITLVILGSTGAFK